MSKSDFLCPPDKAQRALFYEVALSPKPGLVDRFNNGAHHDMNFYTFIDSILALTPFFTQYFELGFIHRGSLDELFARLRSAGQDAEKAMLEATRGINTHKGANFSFAVLLGATGLYLQRQRPTWSSKDTTAVLSIASSMTAKLVTEDFKALHEKAVLSYGEKLYLTYGISGIRGEAAGGYPSLENILLPFLRSAPLAEEAETTFLRGLILLMSTTEDGNLIHRGGIDAWQLIQKESKKIHQANFSREAFLNELSSYDKILTQRHLSPGGAADLLALGIYFAQLEGLL